ncbi:hypothetical protein TNCV_554701 [Trichonephila clavipes]|nr:hypothetical protein TNCV_554701 [Trichonephila clavipes]
MLGPGNAVDLARELEQICQEILQETIRVLYHCMPRNVAASIRARVGTATAGSDGVQSGRPIFDDFFQHLWPFIGNNTANVVFQMVERLWLIRIDQ